MKFLLAGYWQVSPLTDISIPQDDIIFPAPLSRVFPDTLSEENIAQQEWHLMHDVEVDETFLSYKGIDLVIEGIDYFAQVRLNGVAIFDCDKTQDIYRKDIRSLLELGRNRFEILFLEEEDDLLLEEDRVPVCLLGNLIRKHYDDRLGIWREPYLELIRYIRMTHITTEQVWHHGGGCEFIVDLHFEVLALGLVSAAIKFDGLTFHVPIDMRQNKVRAIFQVDAPKYYDPYHSLSSDLYTLDIELDGQHYSCYIGLSDDLCVTHFPIQR
jgi:hypothetical protein